MDLLLQLIQFYYLSQLLLKKVSLESLYGIFFLLPRELSTFPRVQREKLIFFSFGDCVGKDVELGGSGGVSRQDE